jgi:nitrogen fixation protein
MSIDVNVQNDLVIVTESSEDITVNVSNAAGPAGANGVGVPVGGTTGQVLKKFTNTNYDTYWALDGGGVPYSGATGDVNLGEFGLTAGQLTLDVSPTGTAAVGTTRWNNTIGSSETTLKGGSVILKNGVDLVARIVNKVTPNTTLTKAAYQAVRVSGAQGQRLAVAFAQANNDANSADTIGLVTETIATNQEGFIICVGQIENINTTGSLQGETWVDGDVLYLSPFTAGAITKVKPTGNGHIVVIGYVEYAHANNGKIYVKVMNGWELDELHDVSITSVANNDALIYESSSQLWKNKTIASALGYTPISGSGATGQVAYWNGTNSQTGSNNLFWDAANSRLGIGLTNPAYGLDVSSTVRFSTTAMSTGYSFAVQRLQFNNGVAGGNIGVIRAQTNGIIILNDAAETNFTRLCFGAASTSFPGLQRSGLALCVVDGAGGTLGNLIVGGTTDGGQRLQVQGDAFIKGSGATSATSALLVENSSGTDLFTILNNGYTRYGNQSTSAFRVYPGSVSGAGDVDLSGEFLTLNSRSSTTETGGSLGHVTINGVNVLGTSGIYNLVSIQRTFAPTSGTGVFNMLNFVPVINQTGGANGITRGLYINTILTAAADWRSIEWSNNTGWGLYGAGTAPNLLNGSLTLNNGFLQTGGTLVRIENAGGFAPTGSTGIGLELFKSGSISYVESYNRTTSAYSQLNLRGSTMTFTGNSTFINDAIINGNISVGTTLYTSLNRVGIGTATPAVRLEIANGANQRLQMDCTGGANGAFIQSTNNTTAQFIPLDFFANFYAFHTGTGTGSFPERMRLTAAGRLLLGTTTEGTFLLDVNGTARVSGASTFANATFSGSIVATQGASDSGGIYYTRAFSHTVTPALSISTAYAANGSTDVAMCDFIDNNGMTTLGGRASSYLRIMSERNPGAPAVSFTGTLNFINLTTATSSFLSNSSTGNYNAINVNYTINRSGAGIMRGFYYNPTITSLGGSVHNAIETTSGNLIFNNANCVVNSSSINASAVLQADSTTKGFLPPRMTTTQKNAITSPAAGLQVYDTTLNQMSYYNGTTWINF